MRHLHFAASLLLLSALTFSSCSGPERVSDFGGLYYFQPQTNENLYLDLLCRCDTMIAQTKGNPLSEEVKLFREELVTAHRTDACAWIDQTFRFVDCLKEVYPPVVSEVGSDDMDGVIRKNIVLLLDFPMHCDDKSAMADPKVVKRYHHALNVHLLNSHEKLMEWLDSPLPKEGEIAIAKMYSSGLIFRTKRHCLGLDLRWEGSEDDAYRISQKLDALVLTHCHDDHYSYNIFGAVADMGKPMIIPGTLFSNFGGSNRLEWQAPFGSYFDEVELCDGIKVKARMSAQGDVPCLLYMIDFDGWNIAAVGDNSYGEQEQIYSQWEIPDFVCTPIFEGFQNIMAYISQAPNPQGRQPYYLPLHENEYHHGVHARVGYRFLFNSPWALGSKDFAHYIPYVLLDGGESITISRKK